MKTCKLGIAGILLFTVFAKAAEAQGVASRGYNPYGVNGGVYGSTSGFGSFGGAYPNYNGGYRRFGNGGSVPYQAPQTYSNLGGLMGTIQQQTGRPNSYRNGAYPGVSSRRLAR